MSADDNWFAFGRNAWLFVGKHEVRVSVGGLFPTLYKNRRRGVNLLLPAVIALVVAGRNPWRAVRPSRKCAPQCQAAPKSCASPAISCGWSRRRDNRFARVHILDVIRADSGVSAVAMRGRRQGNVGGRLTPFGTRESRVHRTCLIL